MEGGSERKMRDEHQLRGKKVKKGRWRQHGKAYTCGLMFEASKQPFTETATHHNDGVKLLFCTEEEEEEDEEDEED
ncbi:hypothetical protein PAMP_020992 [Pampus punctatissimus]